MPPFKYFAAPNTEIFHYSETEPCVNCGRIAPATLLRGDSEVARKFCCLECLAAGESRVEHDTEIGLADLGGFAVFDDASLEMVKIELPPGFKNEACEELSRTPELRSHQGCEFLIHCGDFMRYLGRWEPEDFKDQSGNPSRAVYVDAADGDSELWDATEREKQKAGDGWPLNANSRWAYGSWCYVFDCLHCGKRRCTWDCD